MATYAYYRPMIRRCSFESTLCSGLADPTTLLTIEVFLKLVRLIFLRNQRGELVDSYETSSDSYACFDSPRLSSEEYLRDQIRLRLPGLSPSSYTKLSQRISGKVAVANNNGGTRANKVTASVEIKEPHIQPTGDDYDQKQEYRGMQVYLDELNDDGVITYSENDDDDHENDEDNEDDDYYEPPRGLSWNEINRLKQERFIKNDTASEEESFMCSICREEFLTGVKITSLLCSHTFHHNCIASWLQKQGSCPLC